MRTLARQTERGFTLIELMIAMVLGLLVVGVIIMVFLTGNRNYAQDERFARMQENGRYVIRLLSEELSNTEFWGGMTSGGGAGNGVWSTDATPALLATDDCGVTYGVAQTTVVIGNATASDASTAFGCIDAATFRSGTDVILLQKVFGAPATPSGAGLPYPYDTGKVYLRTNTSNGTLIKTGAEPADITTAFAIPSQNWSYWEYVPQIYYIRDAGIPTLHRKLMAPDYSMQDEALVEGIEAVHVLFGIDTDSDGVANQFVSNPTAAQMAFAATARIYVLVRSDTKDHQHADAKTYEFGDLCYNVGGTGGCNALTDASAPSEPQKYHRRVFTNTIMLRNPVYRVQLSS